VSGPRIDRLGDRDIDAVAGVIAEAFFHLAPAVWMFPDPLERKRISPEYFRIFAEYGVAHGEVYGVGDKSGVAIWFRPAEAPPPLPADYDDRLDRICGEHAGRCRLFDAALAAHHPHEPCHYLAFLAVLPGRQGAGLGGALLADYHARLAEAGEPAHVEASSTRARDLYLRHGYRPRGGAYLIVPDGPPLWPLWRDPRS
jgi:GNAT superfamily N-acetyltransferase